MNISVGNIIGTGLLSGILGTTGMTLFLYIISKNNLANVDMLRALGSLFTKTFKSAFSVGIVFHMLSGVIFLVYGSIVGLIIGMQIQ